MTAARQIMNCHKKKFELTKNIRHYMLLVKTEATCIDSSGYPFGTKYYTHVTCRVILKMHNITLHISALTQPSTHLNSRILYITDGI